MISSAIQVGSFCITALLKRNHAMRMAVAVLLAPLTMLVSSIALAQNATTLAGSGVVVGRHGEILTNAHVVEGCKNITVQLPSQSPQTAVLVARDQRNDLAVIRSNSSPLSVVAFREGTPLRAGDSVVALGYPLSGLLATTANLSVGIVSALAGLGDDSRYFQISAPVQPGNSGGPLLDTSGHLVGIVTAKLDAMRVAQVTGDIPQNVNFALKAGVAKAFLDSKGIDYRMGRSDQQLSPADVGDVARPFTVYIECRQAASQSAAASLTPPKAKAGVTPAPGQSRDENERRCGDDNPDISIAGCTALIQSGQEPNEPTFIFALAFASRGGAYSAKGQYDLAIRDYDQAINLNPDFWGALKSRGKAYFANRQYDRAIQDYDQAIKLNPKAAFVFIDRGNAYFAKGQHDYSFEDKGQNDRAVQEYDRAIQDYDEGIRLNPNFSFAFIDRGDAYSAKGQYDRAIHDYDQAITLEPNNYYAVVNRGNTYDRQGQHERAIQDYDRAIRLNPNEPMAFYRRGFTKKLFMGDTAGGDADLARAQRLGLQ